MRSAILCSRRSTSRWRRRWPSLLLVADKTRAQSVSGLVLVLLGVPVSIMHGVHGTLTSRHLAELARALVIVFHDLRPHMPPSQSLLLTLIIGISVLTLVVCRCGSHDGCWRARAASPEMQRISDAIQQGAEAFLARQYRTISVLAIVVAILIYVGYAFLRRPNPRTRSATPTSLAIYVTVSFILGALELGDRGISWGCGRRSARTSVSRRRPCPRSTARCRWRLRGGAVAGLFVVAMSLLGRQWPVRHRDVRSRRRG